MKHVAIAALLSICCAAAQAESGWITIQGFYDAEHAADRPDLKLFGRFEGTDTDSDGVLRADEISWLEIAGLWYSSSPGACNQSYHYCGLTKMEYEIGSGTAAFKAYETWTDPEHIFYSQYTFETGVGYRISSGTGPDTALLWRDYTTMTVMAVPEPSTAAMLLLGLAGTAAFARRRRG